LRKTFLAEIGKNFPERKSSDNKTLIWQIMNLSYAATGYVAITPFQFSATLIALLHPNNSFMESKKFKSVDEYLTSLSKKSRDLSQQMRKSIQLAAPEAEEVISYNMPAYRYHGMLVYFAAHTEHIGFYPVSSAIREFKNELMSFETSKGTIKFPFEKGIPTTLVKKIVKFRVKENLHKELAKKKKKNDKK